MSHSLLRRHCFADGRCLFKQPQSVIYRWNQYDEISEKCRSVCPSVCLSVMLNKKAYSSIIGSSKIIRISGGRAYRLLQENEAIFSKNYFSKILD